ncbi:MAG TPA: hypothetical protein VFI84_00565 [Candidatus Saccharimonadales bacterium]|nr:hypothetical protein [Candidatus Saccharimonadales bacterium]
MSPISREFIVVEPPTSAEVQEFVAEAIRFSSTLDLVLLPDQEVPPPQEKPVAITMHLVNLLSNGRLLVLGISDESPHITVRTQDKDQPATASIVFP